MEYKGKLFGLIAGKHFDTGKTSDDWDRLEAENKRLKMCLQSLVDTKKHKELNGKDVTYIAMRKIAWDNANKALKTK